MKRTITKSVLGAAALCAFASGTPSEAAKRKAPVQAPAPVPLPPPAPAPTMALQVYRDGQGGNHTWSIDDGHTLSWDSQPYLPVGGAFEPHYWTDGQTEDNWKADVAALGVLHEHRVLDLYLTSGSAGLTSIPAAAVQRMIDYLDANGFRYGLEIADCHTSPLTGFVVKPELYRQVGPGSTVRFGNLTGLTSAFYGIASTDTQDPILGKAKIVDRETAEATPRGAGPDDVLLLYPERQFLDGTPESRLPDLWQGYDDYRDRLLGYFSHVKLGPGFRFFLDPIVRNLSFEGDVANVVPTSDGYRLGFQAWLVKQYDHNVDDLNQGWGVQQRDLPDFATAARCIPLWNGPKGIPVLYDPLKAATYTIINKPKMMGHEWEDIAQYRRDSVRGYMNALANVLKKSVANVPVVYRCARDMSIYVNDSHEGGFDGLGIMAYGHGTQLSSAASSGGYADIQGWSRPGWLIVSDTLDTGDYASKIAPGYDSRAVLFNDWDELQNVGARGFFTAALQRLPVDRFDKANMVAVPDQLSWMSSYAASFEASPQVTAADGPVLPYPSSIPGLGLRAKKLRSGVWWLPTHQPGSLIPMGPSLHCYNYLDTAHGSTAFVLWSTNPDLSSVRLPFGKNVKPVISDAAGNVMSVKDKNGVWSVPVGSEPIVIRRVNKVPLPLELTDEAKRQADALIKMAADQGTLTDSYKTRLFYAMNKLDDKADTSGLRLTLLSNLVNSMLRDLQPFTRFEGEATSNHTFDSLATDPQASGGAYLSLDDANDPPLLPSGSGHGYQASYKFSVNTPGRYTLWLGGSPLNSDQTSPFSYRVDGGAYHEIRSIAPDGEPYGGHFVWSNLGNLTLKPGNHTLEILVQEKRRADGHYTLAVDALCLTRGDFKPSNFVANNAEARTAQ